MRPAEPRPYCALTRYGCTRLAWQFENDASQWPELEVVNVDELRRVEHVHPDFTDLSERHGLRATPTTAPDTAEERRAARFFNNAFYPWTTRQQLPSLWF